MQIVADNNNEPKKNTTDIFTWIDIRSLADSNIVMRIQMTAFTCWKWMICISKIERTKIDLNEQQHQQRH